uniref:Leucine-rich repeat protein soc-2 homolog n=1 Tax=Timema douglasi TaxID=61478 RepID=A0A7R8Z5Q0_TIMDO|nr:unnamed protein product [Timema douglasi]
MYCPAEDEDIGVRIQAGSTEGWFHTPPHMALKYVGDRTQGRPRKSLEEQITESVQGRGEEWRNGGDGAYLTPDSNELETLPEWTAGCTRLGALFATHNKLRTLPAHLFCSELSCLQTLQLSYNQLGSLPAVLRHIPLQELFLQSNNLTTLPHNFLTASTRMRVLNLSNNRLCELPAECEGLRGHLLEKIYLTGNCLSDNAMDVLGRLTNLHTLHAAYNCITTLPESCIAVWKDLEELLLSGNKLQHLPDNIIHLRHLRVLRVHSNRLQSSPCFAKMASLKVLDLAHNRLDRINLATLVPQQLQFLDLSCNSRLYVDPRQFQVYRAHRPMSLVDVSGQNRTCLPSTPYHEEGGELEPPWKVGFSETAGLREKLYITQIRLPAFCNTEGLFGMFDGGNNNEVPDVLMRAVPRILLEERTVKETANEYMKYTMLSAHRELKEKGQKYGVCGTLCHICRAKPTSAQNNYLPGSQRYVLRVASVGEARAVICRRNGPVTLSQRHQQHCLSECKRPFQILTHSLYCSSGRMNLNRSQIGCSSRFPLVIPDPQITEVTLEDHDEFLIVANKRFWEVVDVDEAVEEVREVGNAILAAKKLQDIAQSYGSEENLSVMVVRFRDLGSEVEQLMRELRHTIRRNRHQQDSTPTAESSMTCGGCCCREHRVVSPGKNGFYDNRVMIPNGHGHLSNGGSLLNCNLTNANIMSLRVTAQVYRKQKGPHRAGRATRPAVTVSRREMWRTKLKTLTSRYLQQREFFSKNKAAVMVGGQSVLMHENGIKKMSSVVPTLERRSYRDSKRSGSGVVRAIRAKCSTSEEEETCSDKSGTQLSEEQFKCWEYMLEQNTQLLFDKELDTLSRGFTRRPMSASLQHRGKALSRSNPHLSEPSPVPFLSRHFGSARSFNPVVRNTPRFSSGRHFLNGGPNAAYFGSLQRLMPYNLEYDFSVIQEKANQDSMEQDGRMKQYWDVATTEFEIPCHLMALLHTMPTQQHYPDNHRLVGGPLDKYTDISAQSRWPLVCSCHLALFGFVFREYDIVTVIEFVESRVCLWDFLFGFGVVFFGDEANTIKETSYSKWEPCCLLATIHKTVMPLKHR